MKNEALKFLKKICKNRVKVTKKMVIFFLMTGGLLLSQVNFSESVDETKPATIKDLKNYDYPNSLHFVSVHYSKEDVKEYKDYYKYLDLLKKRLEYLKEIALEKVNGNNDKVKKLKEEEKKLKTSMEKLKGGNELISQKLSDKFEKNFKIPKNKDIKEINNEYAKRMNEINKLSSNFNNLGIDFAHSIAIGKGAEIKGENGIAIGVDTLSGKDSISLGKATNASGEGNIAIGRDATLFSKTFKGKIGQQIARILNDPNTIVKFENDGDVEYKKTIVIGDGTKSSGNSNIAIGDNAVAMKKRLTLISLQPGGTLSNKDGAEIDARNWNDIAKQFYNPGNEDKRSYKFEAKPVENAIALGKNASAFANNVIAIGKGAISGFESAVSIGENADTEGENSVAIGKNSKIFGESSVAIGEGSRTGKIKYVLKTIEGKDKVVENPEEFDTIEAAKQELEKKKDLSKIYRIEIGGKESENSVAIGKGSAVEYKGSVAIGADSLAVESNGKSAFTEVDHTSGETVSFGNSNKKRRLTNVADGKDSSDAVTVAQLQKAIADNKGGSGGSAVDSKVSVEGGEGIKVTSANNKYTVALADGLKTKIDGALQSDEADGKYAKLDASNITEASWVEKLGDTDIENGTKLAKSSAVKTYVDTEINNISTKVSSKLSSDDVDVKGDAYISVASDATKTNHYTLTFDKEKLGKELDLTNNTNLNTKLAKYALLDGSNLDNIVVNKWAEKLGTGSITANETNLVTGKTVYSAIKGSKTKVEKEGDIITVTPSSKTDTGIDGVTYKIGIDATKLNEKINASKVSVEEGEGIKVTSANNKYTVALADGLKTKIDGALQSDEADGKYAKLDASNITEASWVEKLGDTDIENGTKLAKSSAVKTYVDTEINNISTKVSSKLSSDDVDVKGDAYISVASDATKTNHYTLTFDKEKLGKELDLTNNTNLNTKLSKYALLDGTNLNDDFNLTNWENALGKGTIANNNKGLVTGSTVYNYMTTFKQQLSNESTQDLAKKLSTDASNLTDDGITNLTNKLGTGEVVEGDTKLVTGGKVYSKINEVKSDLDNKYTTLNNQVTTNTSDIKTLKEDVKDLKKTKQDITTINNKLGDIDKSITNINTKLDDKLDKADLSITGDDYITATKGNKFDYTLAVNKTKLESDLDLLKNTSINNMFTTKLGDINKNLGDLTTKVDTNTDNITTLTGKVDTNIKDINTLKQGKLNADADNLSKDGETNLINKLSNGSDISKPNNRLVTDTQVNTYLSRYNDALGVVDKKSTVALEKSELALGGVANAVAMANLVQVNSYSRHRHNLSAAYGYYGGSHALAVGFSGTNEERNFVYKLSGSVNNKGNLAFGVGAGVMLGDKDERLTTEYSTKLKTVEKDLVEANKKIKEYEERQKATDMKVKELERKLNQILNKH